MKIVLKKYDPVHKRTIGNLGISKSVLSTYMIYLPFTIEYFEEKSIN